ncbi:MAG: hypothetical protein K9K67_12570 [Bacteriovoracaceae bacterium]|nr:hypothetical protein [Bacteriovoracaceae bacterium]
MNILKALFTVLLLLGFASHSFASESQEAPTGTPGSILGDIIIKRPPPGEDGPGGPGR